MADFIAQLQEANQQLVDHFTKGFKDVFSEDLYDTFIKQVKMFIEAVDWKNELWIHALFAFQIILLTFAIIARKRSNIQAVLFLLICIFDLYEN
jgi:ABC-type proline/glycine betaine transport system permease subunit